jgi:hypothetical protein
VIIIAPNTKAKNFYHLFPGKANSSDISSEQET